MSCVALIYGVHTFDLPILSFAAIYVALELVTLWWTGFGIGVSLLHLGGAAIGFGVGVAMLKTKLGRLRELGPVCRDGRPRRTRARPAPDARAGQSSQPGRASGRGRSPLGGVAGRRTLRRGAI